MFLKSTNQLNYDKGDIPKGYMEEENVADKKTFNLTTNPVELSVDDHDFILTSGQCVRSIINSATVSIPTPYNIFKLPAFTIFNFLY